MSEEEESTGDLVAFPRQVNAEILKEVHEVEEEGAGMSASPDMFSQGGEGRDQLAGLFSDELEAEEDGEEGDDWIEK